MGLWETLVTGLGLLVQRPVVEEAQQLLLLTEMLSLLWSCGSLHEPSWWRVLPLDMLGWHGLFVMLLEVLMGRRQFPKGVSHII